MSKPQRLVASSLWYYIYQSVMGIQFSGREEACRKAHGELQARDV
jgi:hypothetical protein